MIQLELMHDTVADLPDESAFQSWLDQLSAHLEVSGEVCINVVDASESQQLNLTYRGKDKPTNVLSFPADLPDFVDSEHLGDLAICAEIVFREAKEQGKPELHHWAHMTIHGCLHLLGYDHIKDAEAEQMEALEIELLAALNIPDPYHT
jgi:probable rRNA maturation factor